MELTPTLGQKIINETKKLINENIIIVNNQAIIIASTDCSRIGDFHEGALQTIKNNTTTILTEDHLQSMKGIRPGVNLPITIENHVIGVIGITGNPKEIIPLASLMKKMTELLIRENIYVQELEWHARAMEAYFFEWVQMEQPSEEFLKRGKLLDIHLSPPLRCSIIEIDFSKHKDVINEILDLLLLKLPCVAIRWGHNRIVLLTEEDKFELDTLKIQFETFQSYIINKLRIPFSIGIGSKSNSFFIKDSYQKATKALSLTNANTITAYDELLLETCLDEVSHNVRIDFINKVLSPLDKEEALLNTLKVFLKNNLNLKATASELHIHINTLHYRLSRIEQLTGLNPKNTYTIAVFYIAFSFLDENPKK
ncbi:helix-turn-helix domain-containing protein [Ornithinibacillus sp. BX22]|uniref:Helix-turn-helix domain-containing protein n=2 Tax=Ornithinibacillus TaxID=484508 RepID=A0A923L3G4_9BACI|nr:MULTISPECIES: sugar diacid recognition domain-containing protein [Ornithinibacillus]MBC5635793.1 helix-turn-helix domain-containing protein [Ornithinibacillus hominis]MBS3680218.1 helix-turn-helix domain-containing protein [Ornithinibacillus massiliensis]